MAADRAVEHVQRREQFVCAVTLLIMGHGSITAPLERQAMLRSFERLDLALLIDHRTIAWAGGETHGPTTK